MDPYSPEVYYYLGMSKVNLGDVDGAIADFFQSINLGSRNNNLMTGLSFAYLKAGKIEKSLVYANLALEK
jgi:tetratricopeptide (TPR) repeat protein